MRLGAALYPLRSDLPFDVLAIRDGFAMPDVPCDIYEYFGISVADIASAVRRRLRPLSEEE